MVALARAVVKLRFDTIRWVVLFVVYFTAMMLLKAGRREARALRLGPSRRPARPCYPDPEEVERLR